VKVYQPFHSLQWVPDHKSGNPPWQGSLGLEVGLHGAALRCCCTSWVCFSDCWYLLLGSSHFWSATFNAPDDSFVFQNSARDSWEDDIKALLALGCCTLDWFVGMVSGFSYCKLHFLWPKNSFSVRALLLYPYRLIVGVHQPLLLLGTLVRSTWDERFSSKSHHLCWAMAGWSAWLCVAVRAFISLGFELLR